MVTAHRRHMRMTLTGALLAGLLSTLAGCSGATEDSGVDQGAVQRGEQADAPPVTLENFVSHPKVVEIRKIVSDVEASVARLQKAEKKNLCEGIGDSDRAKFADTEVRKLVMAGGSDDSSYTETYYYAGGVLRFAFREIGSVHPMAREDRRYFDGRGEEIIWVVREATGDADRRPDMSSGKNRLGNAQDLFEISDALKRDPAAAFDAAPVCD